MSNRPILILIAGGSASGKTTVVDKIRKTVSEENLSIICMDNYYKKRDDLSLEERKHINYDHPESIDFNMLKNDLINLMNGNSIYTPVYNFQLHNREPEKVQIVNPTKIVILEGILALYDPYIRELASIQIFVESEADVRFIRRLRRDVVERGRTVDDVIDQYLSTVKPMFDSYVAPTKAYADIIVPNDTKHEIAIEILASRLKELINHN